MMKERSLPAKLAIIGGGYIGLEFSSMYAHYGSTVTVFEHGSRLVKREVWRYLHQRRLHSLKVPNHTGR